MGDPMDWPMDVFCSALDRMRERASAGENKSRKEREAEIIAKLRKDQELRKSGVGPSGPWWID